MKTTNIECKVLSEMYSHGANLQNVEFRPTELKALMRFVYRYSVFFENVEEMYRKEAELFGDAENKASPLRLDIRSNFKPDDKKNSTGAVFEIIFRTRKTVSEELHKTYIDILRLSLFLGGLGKGARKGNGSVQIQKINEMEEKSFSDIETALNFILKLIKDLNGEGNFDSYKLSENKKAIIFCGKEPALDHSFIKRISFGDAYKAPNKALVDIKKKFQEEKKKGRFWGSGIRRVPPLFAGVIKIGNLYYPLYSYLKYPIEKSADNEYKRGRTER